MQLYREIPGEPAGVTLRTALRKGREWGKESLGIEETRRGTVPRQKPAVQGQARRPHVLGRREMAGEVPR